MSDTKLIRNPMIKNPRPMPEEDVRFWADVQANFRRMIATTPPMNTVRKFADVIHFCRMGYKLHTNGTHAYLQATWEDGRTRVIAIDTSHDYTSFEFLSNWKEQTTVKEGRGASAENYQSLKYFRQVTAGNADNGWYSVYSLEHYLYKITGGKGE